MPRPTVPHRRLPALGLAQKVLGVLTLVVVCLAAASMTTLRKHASGEDAYRQAVASQKAALDASTLRTEFQVQHQKLKNLLLRGADAEDFDEYREEFAAAGQAVRRQAGALDRSLGGLGAVGERRRVQEFRAAHEAYEEAFGQAVAVVRGGTAAFDPAAGDAVMQGKDKPLQEGAEALSERLDRRADAGVVRAEEASAGIVALGITGILVATLLGGLAGHVVVRALRRGIREVVGAAEAIAEGDLDRTVDVRTRDELGRLAEAFTAMTASLRETAGAAQQIAGGDLTVEVRPRSDRDTLGVAFATMTESLRTMVEQVGTTAGTVSAASRQMAASSQETGRSTGEIAHAVGEVAHGAQRQVEAVGSARGLTEEVGHATARSADEAREAVGVAGNAEQAASAGVQAVGQATTAMSAVREAADEATRAIRDLGDKSARIGGIVDTITGIAEQTNLLALNAAIEAARAGEQGRGFAVVADEVRKLAEESQSAAGSIAALISEIQDETSRAVEVVELGARRTAEGSDVVAEARDAFEQIGGAVRDMSERVSRIAGSIEEISANAARLQDDIAAVASVADESSASSEQVSAATQQTSASAQEIAASAQELAKTAEELEDVIGRFTLAR